MEIIMKDFHLMVKQMERDYFVQEGIVMRVIGRMIKNMVKVLKL
jgi:hypothetical protein